MSQVTFTQTSGGSASVSISGKVVYGTNFYFNRLNHFVVPIVDGSDYVYDAGPTKVFGSIIMKDISATDKENMLAWIKNSVVFSKYIFKIGGLAGIDWGRGVGIAAGIDGGATSDCRLTLGNTTEGVFEHIPPSIYTMQLGYMFLY
jgi:hypothetical protein